MVRRWQKDGRIGHVGFSTHGPVDLIATACDSGAFDYVNLHWYYIRQDNSAALDAARRQDMGVFIISPTDKEDICTLPRNACSSFVHRCTRSSSTISSASVTHGCTPSVSVLRVLPISIGTSKQCRGFRMPLS